MKLDPAVFRYIDKDAFRVLTSVEMGMKNHQWVPVQLIETIAHLRRGSAYKMLSLLLKHKLVAHNRGKYDGYKLTYNGYDFLALRALVSKGFLRGVGTRIGVGKESDIHVCEGADGEKYALKLHRLGRVSFRTIKANRDYLQHRQSASWMYMARLAAKKEFAYLKALREGGFRVPEPIEQNRHVVLMKFVEARPLYQIKEMRHPDVVLEKLMRLIVRLGRAGLIHGDFNEFNIMIDEKEQVTLIDFPQVVSITHHNAKMYFDRDVLCIREFFAKRFQLQVEVWPEFSDVKQEGEQVVVEENSEDALVIAAIEEERAHVGEDGDDCDDGECEDSESDDDPTELSKTEMKGDDSNESDVSTQDDSDDSSDYDEENQPVVGDQIGVLRRKRIKRSTATDIRNRLEKAHSNRHAKANKTKNTFKRKAHREAMAVIRDS